MKTLSLFLKIAVAFAMLWLLWLILIATGGCSTVHQAAVEPGATASYTVPVKVEVGYLVDGAFRDRYNALVVVYGAKRLEDGAPVFVPPLRQDFGLTRAAGDGWLMTKEAMEAMIVLSDLKRRGAAP